MPATPHQRAFTLRATAKVWRLTARTFAAPPDLPFFQALQRLATAPGLRAKGLTPLEPHLETSAPSEALRMLTEEYLRLCGPEPTCPPNAAHYGLEACHHLDVLYGKDPGHVAALFTALADLFDNAAGLCGPRTPADAAQAAIDLIRLYANRWVPGFLTAIDEHATFALYRNIARMAGEVLADPAIPALLHTLTQEITMLTIYSTTSCGFCYRLKTQLDREQIPYTDVNIEENPTAASYVESVNGGNQVVPTVVCPNGTVMTNPTIHQVKECLAVSHA